MKTSTKATLIALAAALAEDRQARKFLEAYGNLSEHLADAAIDLIAADGEVLAWS